MAKVLLVEDDNNLREIYEARLAAEGYDISSAQDGEEALVVAKQTKPDLVVSDVMMPKISGFEMLDILRNTPGLEHVKVIMLTALGQSEDRDRADSLGADKYLVKSQVTLEDIVKTAHELLGDEAATPPAAAPPETTEQAPTPASPVTPEPAAPVTPTAEVNAPVEPATPDILAQAAEDLDTTAPAPVEPEPVVAAPPAEAPTQATNDAAPDANADGSTVQEQAVVAEQITNFEKTAAPEPAVAPAPEATTPEATTEAQNTASDDQIMANAIDELTDSVTDTSEQPTETPAETSAQEPAVVTPEPTQPLEPEAAKEEAEKTNISITGKKIIQPLDSEPKPDINELLAREEAASGNVVTGAAVVAGSEAGEDEPQETTVDETPAIVHQPGQSFAPQPETEQPAPSAPVDEQPSGAPAPAPSEKKDDDFDPNSVAL